MKPNIREMSPSAYARFAGVLYLIIIVAEIAFPIWLLVKGANRDRWQNRILAFDS